MSQDLRKLFENDREKEFKMKPGHEDRFLQKLDKELPLHKRRNWQIWSIAASVAILLAVGVYTLKPDGSREIPTTIVETENNNPNTNTGITMGDLSPDLKKVEQYYVGQINLELASLEISEENKAVVDQFMRQLNDLNKEYVGLNQELNELGPNDQTISALIKNLQLRLQLLHKLNTTLNNLKFSENEQANTSTI